MMRTYPLVSALAARRSRRFAKGASLDGGPLTYQSTAAPEPLTLDEEAALVFAACGITGAALGELPYGAGADPESGCGNIIVHLIGRTIPSGDSLHSVMLFVLNDEGTWLIRRPQELPPDQVTFMIAALADCRFVEMYERSRVRIQPHRATIDRKVPLVPPFNLWDANLPGTTYFIPVVELTALYINVLLTAFGPELGYYVVDDRAGFRPAGIRPFARSRGGHLHDDPKGGRILPLGYLETSLAAFAASEVGAMHQNLALMAEALGLGGFTHACRHPDWLKALGFDMKSLRFTRTIGSGKMAQLGARALGWPDPLVDIPVGLRHPDRDDDWLVKSFAPPHYRNMKEAVMAFVDYKFAANSGTLTGGMAGAWRDSIAVRSQIPKYSQRAIDATIALCEYVYERYGRFPATLSPFENILAYQAHHLDLDFYDTFYHPEAIGETQRRHRHGGDR